MCNRSSVWQGGLGGPIQNQSQRAVFAVAHDQHHRTEEVRIAQLFGSDQELALQRVHDPRHEK
jgi:hypothetical protein